MIPVLETLLTRLPLGLTALVGTALLANVASSGCGGTTGDGGFGGGDDTGSSGSAGASSGSFGTSTGSSGGWRVDGGLPCPAGLACDACPGGGSTSVTGKVYDPAGTNPLYGIAVYVPAGPLQPLPAGVPTGADACSRNALFKSGAYTSTTTGVDGSFTLTHVPG
jgi:hypothetical protein